MQSGLVFLGLVAFVFFVFSASLVNAADYTCSDPGDTTQRIFRISSDTNAHGATYNGAGNYPRHICYDDYFTRFIGTPTRACTETNVVVRLSGTTNAHAERPEGTTTGYQDVCFDGLLCESVVATGTCAAGYFEMATLSATTNAHLGLPGQYTGAGRYRICCKEEASGGAGRLITGTWRDAAGSQEITKTWVNRTVRLVEFTSLPEDTPVVMEVWEDDLVKGHGPSSDFLANFTTLTLADGRARVLDYLINDANITEGLEGELGDSDVLEFYFIARYADQINESTTLYVNVTKGPNYPPIANITAPKHRGVYYDSTTVTFGQESYDREGGQLSYLCNISEDSFTTPNATFNYTFKSPGQKTITLRVTDSDGAWSEDQVAIVVVSSPGLFAFINRPEHHALVVNHTLKVLTNANESYALNSQGTCPTITVTCIAGACPNQTENSPCGPGYFDIVGTPKGFDELYFDWGFSDGDSAPAADGLGNVIITKQFSLPSETLSDYKWASLRLNYTNTTIVTGGISMQLFTNRLFTLLDARQCIDSGRKWVEYNYTTGDVIETWSTLASNDRCKGYDGLAGSSDDCCPDTFRCSGTPAACVPTNLTRCFDYKSNQSCDDDPLRLRKTDPGWDQECKEGRARNGSIVTCSCAWDSDTYVTGDYCVFSKEYGQGSHNGDGSCTPHQCKYLPTSAPTECVNGYAMVTVKAEFTKGTCAIPPYQEANATCMAGTGPRTVLCGRPSISLDFFGPWQLVIGLFAILAIYWVWWFKRGP